VDRERASQIALSPRVVQLALRTSVIVGSVLNLINQGDALFGDAKLNVLKLLLTYLVPYGVATFSATHALLGAERRMASTADTREGLRPLAGRSGGAGP
jgi:hypothetical protein